jgi:fructose-bisphosphate aldolase class 1
MTSHHLESVALALLAEGKGILAADETIPTLTRRFDTLGIRSKALRIWILMEELSAR